MEVENFVQKKLEEFNIPFKRNIKLKKEGKILVEFDFIIPGAVIEVKTSYLRYYNNTIHGTKVLMDQIKRQESFIPKDFTIYLYFHNIVNHNDKDSENLRELNTDRIKVITRETFNTIQYEKIPIFIESINGLKTLASIENYQNFDMYRTIYTYKELYDKVRVALTKEEFFRFNSFKYLFYEKNKLPKTYLMLTAGRGKNIQYEENNVFTIFIRIIKYYDIMNKYPIRVIRNITRKCKRCSKIFMKNFMDKNICFKCSGTKLSNILKKNKDVEMKPKKMKKTLLGKK